MLETASISLCLYICNFVCAFGLAVMHISISEDVKKQFHAACALRGLKMSQLQFAIRNY